MQALLLASANGAEIAIAVWLTRRWCARQPIMDDIDDLRRFAIASGVFAPAASGLIAFLAFGAQPATLLAVYGKWVTSDALSMLILAPSIMIAIDALRTRRKLRRRELAEWVGLSLAGTALTIMVFVQTTYPLLFLVPPVVVIHAFRLGSLGTACSTIKVAVIALVCTELGHGPINLLTYPETIRLLVLEAFLASAILLGLPVSAVLATRQRFAAELAAQKAELALLAENVTDAILRVGGEGVITYASPRDGSPGSSAKSSSSASASGSTPTPRTRSLRSGTGSIPARPRRNASPTADISTARMAKRFTSRPTVPLRVMPRQASRKASWSPPAT